MTLTNGVSSWSIPETAGKTTAAVGQALVPSGRPHLYDSFHEGTRYGEFLVSNYLPTGSSAGGRDVFVNRENPMKLISNWREGFAPEKGRFKRGIRPGGAR